MSSLQLAGEHWKPQVRKISLQGVVVPKGHLRMLSSGGNTWVRSFIPSVWGALCMVIQPLSPITTESVSKVT